MFLLREDNQSQTSPPTETVEEEMDKEEELKRVMEVHKYSVLGDMRNAHKKSSSPFHGLAYSTNHLAAAQCPALIDSMFILIPSS